MIATIAAIFLFATGLAGAEATPPVLAIRNATIHPASGPVIANGTVVVRNGLIESVGANVNLPPDAWVLEGIGVHVYPGLIDALSTWGMPAAPATPASAPPARGPEDRPSNASWVHAKDLVQPNDRSIADARAAGFTTAVAFPRGGIFAGQGAVLNLAGDKPGAMTVASPVGLRLNLVTGGSTSFPMSLMGVISYIRQIHIDADHYAAARKAYEANPRGTRRPNRDRALDGVLEAPRILLPASSMKEFDRYAAFAAELRSPYVLYGGHQAYEAVELLRKSGAAVLVNLDWPERDKNADPETREPLRVLELREKAATTPRELAKAGVRFAFYSGGVDKAADLRAAAKKAIDAGLAPEDAVRALTLSAAEIYGVADRLGSIEPGKIANLTVTTGDLFQSSTKIKYVVIDGVKYEPEPDGERTRVNESTPAQTEDLR